MSDGLEYDDRIRKEMFSIRELFGDVEFKIFAFGGLNNHTEEGTLSFGVPFEFVKVNHRDSGRKDFVTMLLKEYSFYSQIKKKVKNYDILWVCDTQPFFFPLFSNKPVVWDLHEIPAPLIGQRIKNVLFHRMEKRCRCLIHANQERLNYLIQEGVIKRPQKNLVIRNYPDTKWLKEGESNYDSYLKFKQWIGEDEYIYLQGINSAARYPLETLSAVLENRRIKAVVVGKVSDDIKAKVLSLYPYANDFIYYAGQVVQVETAAFISNCKFSIVFYDTKTPNNRFCEPNRMFQCLAFGKPVIVGCNETMHNLITRFGNGVSLESEGSIIKDNIEGINQMLNNYIQYKEASEKAKGSYLWEYQIDVFKVIFNIV